MSSDSDNDVREFSGFYGKALEPYEEDAVPKKRPIPIEDQVAKDAQGRRRFHGAFTGGFSAGFFNTVGSLEGWKPSEFKSSRSEKAENKLQQPQDYMDDEDMSEFGIAPQKVKATEEFNTSRKRKKQCFADGPIPGEPVLQTLIESGNETIGYLLLRNLGYKHNDDEEGGNNDIATAEEEENDGEAKKIYGCEMPKAFKFNKAPNITECNIHVVYKEALANPKANTFGMSYTGLDRSHINLFTSSKLVVNERNNKKLSISGQAFGVGAFEEDDDDIYAKEDITKYDFELTSEKKKEKARDNRKLILDMFVNGRSELPMFEKFLPPTIPSSFTGKHKVKKSRFEPVQISDSTDKEMTPKRHEIDAAARAAILGETSNNKITPRQLPPNNSHSEIPETSSHNQAPVKTETTRVTKFDQMANGLIFNKFVSAGQSEDHAEILQPVEPSETTHGTKDMREAAKMKMFGPLTRITISWLPNSLVCKRFNIAESVFSDVELKPKRKPSRNLIFETASCLGETSGSNVNYEAGLQRLNETAASSNSRSAEPSCANPVTTVGTSADSNNADFSDVALAATISTQIDHSTTTQQPRIEQQRASEERKALDPTAKLDISKSIDLFKAVFMDSDSDGEDNAPANDNATTSIGKQAVAEGDNAQAEEERIKNEMKARVLAEDLLLPNIKPIKQGILSNVESLMFNKSSIVERSNSIETGKEQHDEIIDNGQQNAISPSDNIYGPVLPSGITFRKCEKLTRKDAESDSSSSMDWIEKGDDKNATKSHKHKKQKKKHKKEKHKGKKHKRKKDRE